MPHIDIPEEELNVIYPSLEVPPECDLQDLCKLEDEILYNQGMIVVQGILNEMSSYGRTRKIACDATSNPRD